MFHSADQPIDQWSRIGLTPPIHPEPRKGGPAIGGARPQKLGLSSNHSVAFLDSKLSG